MASAEVGASAGGMLRARGPECARRRALRVHHAPRRGEGVEGGCGGGVPMLCSTGPGGRGPAGASAADGAACAIVLGGSYPPDAMSNPPCALFTRDDEDRDASMVNVNDRQTNKTRK